MRRYVYCGVLLFVIAAIAGCTGTSKNTTKNVDALQNLETVHLEIEGMTCLSCALGVEYELEQVNGVVDANVNYQNGIGIVRFDPTKTNAEAIAKASTSYPTKVLIIVD